MQTSKRVLVVDDERVIAELVARHLEGEGYASQAVYDAEEAIRALEAARFDLVISDIRMPGKNGLDVLECAKRRDTTLPVIMLTSVTNIDTAVKAMRMGADDYILKPFTLDALDISIERANEHRELLLNDQRYQADLELTVEEKTRKLRLALSEVQTTFNATVEAMVSAIEARDCETQHHCRRAREYTLLLAHRLGIRGEELRDIGWGSLLHDVGKIGVRDDILLKRTSLTPEEWTEMRKHPLIGYRLLAPIGFLAGAAQIVLHHHERWDGTGYPYGKKGEEIPIGARIFALADAIETITSRRCYKEAMSFQIAEEEVLRCSGGQFDPRVIETFCSIPRSHWLAVRKKILAEARLAASEREAVASAPAEPDRRPPVTVP